MKLFDDSSKEEVSNSAKLFESMSFSDSHFSGILDQLILAEVSYPVLAIIIINLLDQMVLLVS